MYIRMYVIINMYIFIKSLYTLCLYVHMIYIFMYIWIYANEPTHVHVPPSLYVHRHKSPHIHSSVCIYALQPVSRPLESVTLSYAELQALGRLSC